jgi:hypothetical protein
MLKKGAGMGKEGAHPFLRPPFGSPSQGCRKTLPFEKRLDARHLRVREASFNSLATTPDCHQEVTSSGKHEGTCPLVLSQSLSAPNARHVQRTCGSSSSRCATRRCATRARNSPACRQIGQATLRHGRPLHPPVLAFDRYPFADSHTDQELFARGAQRSIRSCSSICADSCSAATGNRRGLWYPGGPGAVLVERICL